MSPLKYTDLAKTCNLGRNKVVIYFNVLDLMIVNQFGLFVLQMSSRNHTSRAKIRARNQKNILGGNDFSFQSRSHYKIAFLTLILLLFLRVTSAKVISMDRSTHKTPTRKEEQKYRIDFSSNCATCLDIPNILKCEATRFSTK